MRECIFFLKDLIVCFFNLKFFLIIGNCNLGLDLEVFKEWGIFVVGVVDRVYVGLVGFISIMEYCVVMIFVVVCNIV